uniref:DUF5641 domain-containing protein n=1 Tax=Panagrellus redivivus TaxID=6233 RepID=A0A7E4UYA8_PANRE
MFVRELLAHPVSEIEGAMNRRPLMYVPEMEDVLTPSHFLLVPRNNTLTLDIDNDDDSTYQADSKQTLIDRWRKKMAIYSRFIQRWETEYLGFLRERSKQLSHEGRHRQSDLRPLVGDVVLLRDNELVNDPMKWPLAKVISTHGTDNYSNATIKTQHGQLLKRPVNMLYPLELSSADTPSAEMESPPDPQRRQTTRSARPSAFTYLMLLLLLWLQTAKAQCQNCSSCSFGGVELHYPSKLDSVKLCIYSRCFIYSEVTTDETILLPLSITSDTYTASISGWIGNEKVMANQLICEAATICELVKCRLCMDYIWNIHCDYWTAIYVGVIIVLLSGILMRVLACVGCVRTVFHTIWHCITCFRSSTSVRRRRRLFQIALLSLVLQQTARSCNPATTFMAKSETCVISESGLIQCSVKSSAIITTKAGQRLICLQIKDPINDLTVFTVKVAIQQVVLRCQSNTLFYTRDHQIQTISSKRCAGAGSCTGDKCDGIKSTDHIAELQKGNDHPGYTHCAASCGCAACGCFRCDTACLFYRVYAKPTSPKLYKVSSCSVYAPIVSFNLIIEGIDNSSSITYSSNSFEKEPGTPTTWKNITTTILTVTVPPLPILSSKFLTNLDTSATRVVETAGAGQPVSGTIGQLQCKSLEDAKAFTNCYFPPNTCNCDLRQDTAECICPRLRIQKLMKETEYRLPMLTGGVKLYQQDDSISAMLMDSTDMQLKMDFDNMKITSMQSNATCSVNKCNIKGCKDCEVSPTATVSCKTSHGMVIMELTCPSFKTTFECSHKEGEKSKPIILTKNEGTNEQCKVTCPAGRDSVVCRYTTTTKVLNMAVEAEQHGNKQEQEEHLPDVDDLVYVELHRETYRNPKKKLAPKWKGPARVVKIGKTHATIVFVGKNGFHDIPLSQLVKVPPELECAPENATHTNRRGRRVMDVNVIDIEKMGFYGSSCTCPTTTAKDILPYTDDSKNGAPKDMEELAMLVAVTLSTEIPEKTRARLRKDITKAGELKVKVPTDLWKDIYHKAMVKCPHLRQRVRDKIKNQEVLDEMPGKDEAIRKAMAQVEGIAYHQHDEKNTLVIGGRNAEILAKSMKQYKVISTVPGDLVRITHCMVSRRFTHAIIWPEQQLFTDIEPGEARERCREAIKSIRRWNPHLKVTMLPMLPMEDYSREWKATDSWYLNRSDESFRASALINGKDLCEHLHTSEGPELADSCGILTNHGAEKVKWYLQQINATTDDNDPRQDCIGGFDIFSNPNHCTHGRRRRLKCSVAFVIATALRAIILTFFIQYRVLDGTNHIDCNVLLVRQRYQ